MKMKVLVAATTTVAVLLGVYLGYGTAGIGGAMLYALVIGIGGALAGALMARTALLLRHRLAIAAVALVLLMIFTWDVYF